MSAMCSVSYSNSEFQYPEMATYTIVIDEHEECINMTPQRSSSFTFRGVKSTRRLKYYKRTKSCDLQPIDAISLTRRTMVTCSTTCDPLLPIEKSLEPPIIRRRMRPKQLCSRIKKKRRSKRHVCNFCDRLFKSKECLVSHHEVHGITYWKSPFPWMGEDKLPNCDDERQYDQENGCDEEDFTCQVCDMIFATAGGLSKHMDVHRMPYNKMRFETSPTPPEYITEEGHALIDLT